MRRVYLLGLLTMALLLCGAAQAQQVRLASPPKVEKVQNRVTLTWQAETEQEVAAYEIQRKTPTSMGHVLLHTLPAHGPGKAYTYTDADLYKEVSALADYQLVAVYRNGSRQAIFNVQVNYTTTGLRRTWGSLKAMFQ